MILALIIFKRILHVYTIVTKFVNNVGFFLLLSVVSNSCTWFVICFHLTQLLLFSLMWAALVWLEESASLSLVVCCGLFKWFKIKMREGKGEGVIKVHVTALRGDGIVTVRLSLWINCLIITDVSLVASTGAFVY